MLNNNMLSTYLQQQHKPQTSLLHLIQRTGPTKANQDDGPTLKDWGCTFVGVYSSFVEFVYLVFTYMPGESYCR